MSEEKKTITEVIKEIPQEVKQLPEETKVSVEDPIAGAFAGVARATIRAIASIGRSGIAGTMAGMSEEVAGYPLDIVKTRMQVAAHNQGTISVIKHIIQTEGFTGLFSGLTGPVIGASFINAALFGVYGRVLLHFERQQQSKASQIEDPNPHHFRPTVPQVFISGATAGLAQAFIVTPIDVVKNRMQVLGLGHGASHTPAPAAAETVAASAAKPAAESAAKAAAADITSWTMAKMVWKEGGVRSVFRGMVPTLIRDIPGYGCFFASYEFLKSKLTPPGKQVEEAGIVAVIASGGIAGMAYHASTYPFDVVKSRIQITPLGSTIYSGTWDCLQKIVKAHGIAGLYKGFGPTVFRAFPASGVGFVAYELTLNLLP
eukprot:GEZU01020237.1.p1 GENE.GEZU01020237.1~~GEZU01020237.1.p1  ORF type:complete len:388 (+),score=89.13 GEZU01020237.1:47-1165(+)